MVKLLIISTHPTHPAIEGNRRFIFNQVELFKKMGYDVHFLLIQLGNSSWGNTDLVLKEMSKYWQDKLYVFRKSQLYFKLKFKRQGFRNVFNNGYLKADDWWPSGLDKYVEKLQDNHHFDACIINYYILSKLFTKVKFPLMAVNSHDYFGYKNLLTSEKSVWLGTTPNEEAKALQRCPHIFALNTEEAIYFQKLSPLSKVYNVFSIYYPRVNNCVGNQNLLFLSGNNNYNINGLNWFLEEIFPAIVKKYPMCSLIIGGGICKNIDHLKKCRNIKLVGYVDNFNDFYDQGDVVINPTYQGTGLKIKTFEGIANDKIVMAHPHSKIGIFNPDKAPLFTSLLSSEWVSFLESVWNNQRKVEEIKKQDRDYLRLMNDFIVQEYKRCFSCLNNRDR